MGSTSQRWGFLFVALIVLALGPMAKARIVQTVPPIVRTPLPTIPGCDSLHEWTSDWMPVFVSPDYQVAESYQCEGYRLHVNVVQYVEQHQGKEAVGEFNSIIPRSWWNITTRGRQFLGRDLEVDEYRVERSPQRLTIWNWYVVGAQPASSEFAAKAMEAVNALRLRSMATTNLTVAIEADPAVDARTALAIDAAGIWSWFRVEMESEN